MESGTTLSAPRICYQDAQSYLSPVSSRQGQTWDPEVHDGRGRDLPSHQETPLVLGTGPGPSLAASLSFPQAAQPRPGHGQTHSTSHTTALFAQGCPGEATVKPLSPVIPGQAAGGQKQPKS